MRRQGVTAPTTAARRVVGLPDDEISDGGPRWPLDELPPGELCACRRGPGPCGIHWDQMSESDRQAWRRRLGLP